MTYLDGTISISWPILICLRQSSYLHSWRGFVEARICWQDHRGVDGCVCHENFWVSHSACHVAGSLGIKGIQGKACTTNTSSGGWPKRTGLKMHQTIGDWMESVWTKCCRDAYLACMVYCICIMVSYIPDYYSRFYINISDSHIVSNIYLLQST